MSDNTANAAITGTAWLVLPEELRTQPWLIFDKETHLPLDKYILEYLTNRYRLKLKDFYPTMSAKEIRARLVAFKERLGEKK
jgi:hypothetical protein